MVVSFGESSLGGAAGEALNAAGSIVLTLSLAPLADFSLALLEDVSLAVFIVIFFGLDMENPIELFLHSVTSGARILYRVEPHPQQSHCRDVCVVGDFACLIVNADYLVRVNMFDDRLPCKRQSSVPVAVM